MTIEPFARIKKMQAECIRKKKNKLPCKKLVEFILVLNWPFQPPEHAINQPHSRLSTNVLAVLTMDIDFLIKSLKGSVDPTGATIKKLKADGTEDTTETAPATNGPVAPSHVELAHLDGDKASIWQDIIITYKKNKVHKSTMVASFVSQ